MCQYFKILKVIINLVVISVCVGKIALFGKALVVASARGALAMCAMWVGLYFIFSFGKHFIGVAVVLALQVTDSGMFLLPISEYVIVKPR